MNKRVEVIETPDQKQIRKVLSNFPYTGMAELDFGEMTYKNIADNLTKLEKVVRRETDRNAVLIQQYADLKADIEAVRRVIGTWGR